MNRYLVEFVGTMFFAYVILSTGNALAIGAALTLAILVGGPVSGGAFNPAVAAALVATGKLPKADFIPYTLAEIGGALAAFQLYTHSF